MFIFNITGSTGGFPEDWKSANVVPIFKKGSWDELDNYRPVSQLSGSDKTTES